MEEMDNITNHVYLRDITLHDYKCFKGDNKFTFVSGKNTDTEKFKIPQCTVFLGDNGTGKTNILKAIANMIPVKVNISDKSSDEQKQSADGADKKEIPDFGMVISAGEQKPAQPKTMYRPNVIERYSVEGYTNSMHFSIKRGENTKLRQSDYYPLSDILTRFIDKNGNQKIAMSDIHVGYTSAQNNVTYDRPELDDLVVFGYGVNRFADTQRNLKSGGNVDTLFYNNKPLINLEEWLLQLFFATKSDPKQKEKAHKRLNLLKDIFNHSRLFPDIKGFKAVTDDDLNTHILFETSSGDYPLHELGYGYQCMFAWIFDFIKKMIERYPDSKAPLKESAVLLLDEVDLHLHPQWQRHVLKDLCDLFPNTQIIATTHSPLVIQSADNMNLYVLTNKDGKTTAKFYEATTFQGWSVEEILSELMDLGDDGVRSDTYLKLRSELDHAMNMNNISESLRLYNTLKKMLHPGSQEAEDLDLDIEDLKDRRND
jgi:predicted ATP-binding protein involved in virulence